MIVRNTSSIWRMHRPTDHPHSVRHGMATDVLIFVNAAQRHIKPLLDGLLCDWHLLCGQAKHSLNSGGVSRLGLGFVIPVEHEIPLPVYVVFGRSARSIRKTSAN